MQRPPSFAATLERVVSVRPGEGRALAWAFLYSFSVLAAWYVLRPIREAFAVEDGTENLQWLFSGTFLVMLGAVPAWSWLVARYPRRVFAPLVYHFFPLNVIGFWVVLATAEGAAEAWARRAFFVWTSVFVLFAVSAMWSFLVDLFREDQCRRLFGFIAAGGTLGGLCGSVATSSTIEWLDISAVHLFAGPVVLLEAAVLCIARLDRLRPAGQVVDGNGDGRDDEGARPVGGGLSEGFTAVARSPYLILICGYMLFATLMGTLVYFQTNELVGREIPERADRVALFANVNVAVQSLTVLTQAFLAPRCLSRLGVGVTLVVLPLVTFVGFGALGLVTSLGVVVVFDVLRRTASYGLAKPTKEVLFAVVPREDKYKAKSFIDTAVYRGGDALSGWAFKGMRTIGLDLSTIAWVGVPLALVWAALSWRIGRREERMADEHRAERTRV
jgi:AAA family ATP:ADP antiporter